MDVGALGIRSHSGWATLVAVAGPVKNPAIVLRRRIELSRNTPRQPFHAAEGLPFRQAEALIRQAEKEARSLASRAIREAVDELGRAGRKAATCGLLLSAGRPLPGLRAILASHALIHAAEGELFREALREGGRSCTLGLVELKEREAFERTASVLGLSGPALKRRIDEWGRPLGPPWRQDEKLAALVAWLALGTRAS
jgi:hypothetical protein